MIKPYVLPKAMRSYVGISEQTVADKLHRLICYGVSDDELVLDSIDTNYVTMTRYDVSFDTIPVLFDKENIENTLGEAISKAGLTQLRMAETEKYPHVTYFFNGERKHHLMAKSDVSFLHPR